MGKAVITRVPILDDNQNRRLPTFMGVILNVGNVHITWIIMALSKGIQVINNIGIKQKKNKIGSCHFSKNLFSRQINRTD